MEFHGLEWSSIFNPSECGMFSWQIHGCFLSLRYSLYFSPIFHPYTIPPSLSSTQPHNIINVVSCSFVSASFRSSRSNSFVVIWLADLKYYTVSVALSLVGKRRRKQTMGYQIPPSSINRHTRTLSTTIYSVIISCRPRPQDHVSYFFFVLNMYNILFLLRYISPISIPHMLESMN